MAGFVIGLLEPDHTGHITTIGIAPEHRRRRLASYLLERVESSFRRRDAYCPARVRPQIYPHEAIPEPQLHRDPASGRGNSNGGDGLLMVKPHD